jgi:hypothetical protein
MKITKQKLIETVQAELKTVLIERYVREEMMALLKEEKISTRELEKLLARAVEVLEDIDVSIDYLSATMSGVSAAEIELGQATIGRGVSARQPRANQTVAKKEK